MISIKKAELTQKDVKNEGRSQYVVENKGRKMTHFGTPQYVYENKGCYPNMPISL
jgi:hypothetical protein